MIGRIYKLTSTQSNQCYIGSTTRSIYTRLTEHNYNYYQYKNGKYHYTSSYDIVKFDDAKIELLEEREFKDKKEMLERERFYIDSNENAVNQRNPITTKEDIKERKAKYYTDNKEQINKKKKEKINV